MSDALVIDQGFVLPFDYGINEDNPIIGYSSVLEDAVTITATSETTTEPASNLRNGSTYLAWQATAPGAQSITIDLGVQKACDYFGLAVHNLATAGGTVSLEYNITGSEWVQIVAPIAPENNGVLFVRFTQATARYWRLNISGLVAAPARIAVFYLGPLLVLQRRIYSGISPHTFGRKTTLAQGRSETGHFLGRVLKYEFLEHSIDQKNLTPEWVRAKLLPFFDSARLSPFFWAWRPTSYANECGFGWFMDDPTTTNQGAGRLMQASMKVQSIRL